MPSIYFTLFGLVASFYGALTLASESNGRTLHAATKRSNLKTRSAPFELSNEVVLAYADDSNTRGETAYAGTVCLKSKKPILVLEEMEQWLSSVKCTSDSIILSKAESIDDWTLAKVSSLVDGHIITSHSSCNKKHERVAYKVRGIQDISAETVTLRVTPAPWKSSFESIDIDFGYTDEAHVLRAHTEVRRSLSAQQDSSGLSPDAVLRAAIPSITQEVPEAVGTDAPTSTQLDIAATIVNQRIDVPGTNNAFELTCVRCETAGTIDFTAANFNFDYNPFDDGEVSLSGAVTATANGVKAHIELASSLQDSWEFITQLGILNQTQTISVPGLGAATFMYGPFIAGGYNLNGTVALTSYGLTMEVPSGATAGLSIDTIQDDEFNATQSLFDQTTFTALPINSDVQIDALSFWLAYRMTLQASFSFDTADEDDEDGSDFNLRAGIFFDCPILNGTITPLADVNGQCESGGDLQDVVNIDYAVGWNFGVYGIGKLGPLTLDSSAYYAGSIFTSPPSQCLQFDDEAKAYQALSGVEEAEAEAETGGDEDAAGRTSISIAAMMLAAVGAIFVMCC